MATAQTLPDDVYWDTGFAGLGVDGRANATLSTPRGLIVAGSFSSIDGVPALGVALLPDAPRQWVALGGGVNGEVFAVALVGDRLYVGGAFDSAGGVPARNIARWSFATATWEPIVDRGVDGADAPVRALALVGGAIFVGGEFRHAGAEVAIGIARLDTTTMRFTAMDSLSVVDDDTPSIYTFEVAGPDLYAGGRFDAIGSMQARNIARWSGTGWHTLGMGPSNGVNARVHDVLVTGDSVVVAGEFVRAGLQEIVGVARWISSSESWQGFVPTPQGLRGSAYAIAWYDGALVVGGAIVGAGFDDTKGIVQVLGGGWSVVGGNLDGNVHALTVHRGDLITAGSFAGVNGVATFSLGKWDGSMWSSVAGDVGGAGPTGQVYALALDGQRLYVGGTFTSAGGRSATRIARWNAPTQNWDTLGLGTDGPVYALTPGAGRLWIGGRFGAAGDLAASNIVSLDLSSDTWHLLGSDLAQGVTGTVHALALSGTTLFVGGDFHLENDSLSLDHLAAYDIATNTWWNPGPSPNGPVYAIAVIDELVYVGGDFTEIGDISGRYIAQYTPGKRLWEPLGAGMSGPVRALVVGGATLYVGGDFVTAGTLSAPLVARWISDIGYWDRLGDGLDGTNEASVHSLAISGGAVWATGFFANSGTTTLRNIARWDTTTRQWGALGSGVVGAVAPVGSSIVGTSTEIYVGGGFTHVGGRFSPYLARWTKVAASAPSHRTAFPSWMSMRRDGADVVVAVDDGSEVYLEVLDLLGCRLGRTKGSDGEARVHLDTYSSGQYLLVVRAGDRLAVVRIGSLH